MPLQSRNEVTGIQTKSGQVLKSSRVILGSDYILPVLNSLSISVETLNFPQISRCALIADSSLIPGKDTLLITIPPNCEPFAEFTL